MPFPSTCIRLLQLCWKHYCLPNLHKHAAKLRYFWMMPLPLPWMPCIPWFQLHCKSCLEDSHYLETCFLTFLFLQTGMQFLHKASSFLTICLFLQPNSISNLTTRLIKRFSSMTKLFKAHLNQKLQGSLKFSGFTIMALRQLYCNLALLNMWMVAAPSHIGSPHLSDLTWNLCFFLIEYREGKCYAQLCLSQDSWESPFVDSHSSVWWFFVMSWEHAIHVHHCPSVVLSLWMVNALSSSTPTLT